MAQNQTSKFTMNKSQSNYELSITLNTFVPVLVLVHPLGGVLQYPGWALCSSTSGSIPSYIRVQLGNKRGAPLAYILLRRTLKTLPPHLTNPQNTPAFTSSKRHTAFKESLKPQRTFMSVVSPPLLTKLLAQVVEITFCEAMRLFQKGDFQGHY